MNEWELEPQELDKWIEELSQNDEPPDRSHAYERGLIEKYHSWLAKQVEKPCEGCKPPDNRHDCDYSDKRYCPDYRFYLGQQSGYAKGIQEGIAQAKARHETRSIRACQETGR